MKLRIKTSDGSQWELPGGIVASKVAVEAVRSPNGRINYEDYSKEVERVEKSAPPRLMNYVFLNWDALRHLAIKVSGPIEQIEDIEVVP